MTDRRRRQAAVAALILLAAVAVAEQAHAVYGVTRHYVTGDQAIMWVAARDWGRFAFHQPTFYGQSYWTNFEGIPIEALRRLGVPLTTAAPFAYAALNVGCWLVLGAAAWRRGRYHLAALAFAAPTLLTSFLSVYNSYVGSTGRLAAVAGGAGLLIDPEARPARGVAWVLLIGGSVLDGSALVFTVPVAAWVLIRRLRLGTRPWRPEGLGAETATMAVAAIPALAWVVGLRAFFAAHPDYAMTDLSLRLHRAVLRQSLDRPEQFFHMFAPELWRAWWLPLLVLVGLVVVLIASRRWERAVPGVLVVALVLAVMSTTRAGLVRDVFVLPRARLLAGLPYALWFLFGLATGLDDSPPRRSGHGVSRFQLAAIAAIAGLALTTAAVRLADFDGRVASATTYGTHTKRWSPPPPNRHLVDDCHADAALARSAGTGLVVYLHDHASAYGCAALGVGVDTLTPGWERRTWRLTDEASQTRRAVVLVGVDPDLCAEAEGQVSTCRTLEQRTLSGRPETTAVVTFPRRSAIDLLRSLDVPVRGFGPGCHLIGGPLHHVPQCRAGA